MTLDFFFPFFFFMVTCQEEKSLFPGQSRVELEGNMLLLQDLGWPEALPYWDFFFVTDLSDSSIKAICSIAFFLMILPIYHYSSPLWARGILVELQNQHICHNDFIMRNLTNIVEVIQKNAMGLFKMICRTK